MVEELVEKGIKYDVCIAIGPMIMMKFRMSPYKKLEIPTVVRYESDHGRWNGYSAEPVVCM